MAQDQQIIVQRTIDASAKDIFEVLTNPERHAELDGSGFVRSDEKTDRIQAVGEVFTMNMSGDHMGGDYQTDNHVTAFDPHKMVGWKTAPAGTEPPGWEWLWELEPQGPDSTLVTHTYDWTALQDPDRLARAQATTSERLRASIDRLAAIAEGAQP